MKNNTIVGNQGVNKKNNFIFDENTCPVTAAMKVIGGKWKPILINCIYLESPARFGELKRKLKGITQTMLTAQLRELEADGIINRKIYPEIPPKVEYTLTEFGATLKPIIKSLADWGIMYRLNKNLGKAPQASS